MGLKWYEERAVAENDLPRQPVVLVLSGRGVYCPQVTTVRMKDFKG